MIFRISMKSMTYDNYHSSQRYGFSSGIKIHLVVSIAYKFQVTSLLGSNYPDTELQKRLQW